jgi:nitrite reductase/ring-hydroxylating ferredoxin subunit
MILSLVADDIGVRNLSRMAGDMGLQLIEATSVESAVGEDLSPSAVFLELEGESRLGVAAACKKTWPQAMVVGIIKVPDAELWRSAEEAGCDLVVTRGALRKAVPPRLNKWIESPRGRRVRLFAMADIAGRLGVVSRITEEQLGPLAIYHIGNEVYAVEDLCPHAGAMLSRGEVSVDDGIVTCPEHGSQFETKTGHRVRGPADDDIRTFPVIVEDGQAYLQLENS